MCEFLIAGRFGRKGPFCAGVRCKAVFEGIKESTRVNRAQDLWWKRNAIRYCITIIGLPDFDRE